MIVFNTDRLRLRCFTHQDIDNLLAIFSDPEAMRFFPGVKDRSETEEWLRCTIESYKDNGFGPWAVLLKDNNTFVGYCGLYVQKDVDGRDEVELLYGIIRKYWNHGYATEAARATYMYSTRQLGLKRLIPLIDPQNARSLKVAENVGMHFEKEVRRWNRSLHVYSIDESDQ